MKHWMFRCKDISEKVSLAMDIRLPLSQRLMIRIHLMMCRHCLRFYRQLNRLRHYCQTQEIPQTDFQAKLSPQAKKRIKDLLVHYGK